MTKLRILAAGRGRTMSQPMIVEAVMSLIDQKVHTGKPKLVYLGTASYDKSDAFAIQTVGYQSACDVVSLKVSEAMEIIPSKVEIQETIGLADIILVSGGNTLYAVNRWKELGIDEMIQQASERGAVLCGGSAGAICWFDEGHSDSMDPTTFLTVDPNLTKEQKKAWSYIRVRGLGYLPALCVPHHDTIQSNGIPRALDSENMMKEKIEQTCLGIDENAALVVKGDKVWVVSTDGISKCFLKRFQPFDVPGDSILVQNFDASIGPILLSDLWEGSF